MKFAESIERVLDSTENTIVVKTKKSFFGKSKYITVEDGNVLTFFEMMFDLKERDKLLRILSERDVKEIAHLKYSDAGSLKLRVASTPDGDLCYVQAMAYIPHQYENISDVIRLTPREGKIISELRKHK